MSKSTMYRSCWIKEKTLKIEGKRPIKYYTPQFYGAKKYATMEAAEGAVNELRSF